MRAKEPSTRAQRAKPTKAEMLLSALLEDPKRLKARVAAELARRSGSKSFWAFVQQAWQYVPQVEPLVDAWHMRAICAHAEAYARGQFHELVVNVPPGHSKSVIWCVLLPAWVWTWWPQCQMVFGSYSHTFALRDARRTQDVLKTEWYQATYCRPSGWAVREDFGGADNIHNTTGGVRLATSVGGAGAGLRAHLIVVDDPVNIEAGNAEMEAADRWISQVVSQRFIAGYPKRLAIVMQRLSPKDPTARALKRDRTIPNLRLPSEYRADKPCVTYTVDGKEFWRDPRTQSGELLFEQLYPRKVIEQAKTDLGPFGYAAQHGQDPSADGGGRFDAAHWRFWKTGAQKMAELGYGGAARPEGCTSVEALEVDLDKLDDACITVDTNVRKTKKGSFFSIHVWAKLGARRLLLDRDKGRWEFSEGVMRLKTMIEKWPGIRILVEAKANGDAIISTLSNEPHFITGLVPVEPGDQAKSARAKVMEPPHAAGNMELPEGASWAAEVVKEYQDFPNGESDDEVDCGAMAIQNFQGARTAADWYEELEENGGDW